MELKDLMYQEYKDKGFSRLEYRVLTPDLRVVCTTKDLAKAERIAEQSKGTIHPSRELK